MLVRDEEDRKDSGTTRRAARAATAMTAVDTLKTMWRKRTEGDSRSQDDAGAILITVLMVALFFFIAVITVATYATYSVQDTGLHKSRVASYVSAESARDQGIADLQNAECSTGPVSVGGSDFDGEYRMYWLALEEGEEVPDDVIDDNGMVRDEFEPGCASPQDMVNLADGDMSNPVAYSYIVASGHSGGVTNEVVSVYSIDSDELEMFGYSISSYGTVGFGGIPGIYEPSGEKDIVLAEGSLICTNLSEVEGSVFLMDPDSHSNIGNCGVIKGDLHTAGDININGGNQGLIIEGNLCVEGRVTAAHHQGVQHSVAGNVTTEAGPGGCPALEVVKENMWVDYNPDLSDAYRADEDMCIDNQNWDGPPHYTEKGALTLFVEDQTEDIVIDLTHCDRPLDINGWTTGGINIQANITVVADNINRINSLPVRSADGGEYNFNIIVPDRVSVNMDPHNDRPAPHCEGRNINISMLDYDENTAGLIYSPCGGINFETGNFRGQLYVGADGLSGGGGRFTHVDVEGLPTNEGGAVSVSPPQIRDLTPVSYKER